MPWCRCRWTDEDGGQRCALPPAPFPRPLCSGLRLHPATLPAMSLCSGAALLRAFGSFPVRGLSLQSGRLFCR